MAAVSGQVAAGAPVAGAGSGRVLVVASDEDLLDLLLTTLGLAGYDVEQVGSGPEGVTRARAAQFDLLIVDTSLRGLRHIPRWAPQDREMPVLFLVPGDQIDMVASEVGFSGDDYLSKPLRVGDLLARVGLLLRGGSSAGQHKVLVQGDLRLDEATCRAWRGERDLDLGPAEYRLLRTLLLHAGTVLSKEQIARRVWGDVRDDNAIERLVSRLRRKVDREQPALIRTQRGFGYSLVVGD
ncbi:response regulator transcription factor [Promicromonospora sp. NPDC057138]|uniref:response regulator transcription factor n=1 Tax=Promicromonospora sp. NPDC057138 TaxID=3346031 RepID=UPI0036334996